MDAAASAMKLMRHIERQQKQVTPGDLLAALELVLAFFIDCHFAPETHAQVLDEHRRNIENLLAAGAADGWANRQQRH